MSDIHAALVVGEKTGSHVCDPYRQTNFPSPAFSTGPIRAGRDLGQAGGLSLPCHDGQKQNARADTRVRPYGTGDPPTWTTTEGCPYENTILLLAGNRSSKGEWFQARGKGTTSGRSDFAFARHPGERRSLSRFHIPLYRLGWILVSRVHAKPRCDRVLRWFMGWPPPNNDPLTNRKPR